MSIDRGSREYFNEDSDMLYGQHTTLWRCLTYNEDYTYLQEEVQCKNQPLIKVKMLIKNDFEFYSLEVQISQSWEFGKMNFPKSPVNTKIA